MHNTYIYNYDIRFLIVSLKISSDFLFISSLIAFYCKLYRYNYVIVSHSNISQASCIKQRQRLNVSDEIKLIIVCVERVLKVSKEAPFFSIVQRHLFDLTSHFTRKHDGYLLQYTARLRKIGSRVLRHIMATKSVDVHINYFGILQLKSAKRDRQI